MQSNLFADVKNCGKIDEVRKYVVGDSSTKVGDKGNKVEEDSEITAKRHSLMKEVQIRGMLTRQPSIELACPRQPMVLKSGTQRAKVWQGLLLST